MKNLNTKISIAAMTLVSIVSSANAGQNAPIDLPEPGTFGMFAGAAAVAIILARIIKKK